MENDNKLINLPPGVRIFSVAVDSERKKKRVSLDGISDQNLTLFLGADERTSGWTGSDAKLNELD